MVTGHVNNCLSGDCMSRDCSMLDNNLNLFCLCLFRPGCSPCLVGNNFVRIALYFTNQACRTTVSTSHVMHTGDHLLCLKCFSENRTCVAYMHPAHPPLSASQHLLTQRQRQPASTTVVFFPMFMLVTRPHDMTFDSAPTVSS